MVIRFAYGIGGFNKKNSSAGYLMNGKHKKQIESGAIGEF